MKVEEGGLSSFGNGRVRGRCFRCRQSPLVRGKVLTQDKPVLFLLSCSFGCFLQKHISPARMKTLQDWREEQNDKSPRPQCVSDNLRNNSLSSLEVALQSKTACLHLLSLSFSRKVCWSSQREWMYPSLLWSRKRETYHSPSKVRRFCQSESLSFLAGSLPYNVYSTENDFSSFSLNSCASLRLPLQPKEE